MKLQHVRRDAGHDLPDEVIAGVDAQGHDARPVAGTVREALRGREIDIAGAGGKEDQADEIGAAVEGHVHRLGCLEPADFDLRGHAMRVLKRLGHSWHVPVR